MNPRRSALQVRTQMQICNSGVLKPDYHPGRLGYCAATSQSVSDSFRTSIAVTLSLWVIIAQSFYFVHLFGLLNVCSHKIIQSRDGQTFSRKGQECFRLCRAHENPVTYIFHIKIKEITCRGPMLWISGISCYV